MTEIAIERLLEALLKMAETGQLPSKKADMLRNLEARRTRGQAITEMQEELLRDLGEQYGIS